MRTTRTRASRCTFVDGKEHECELTTGLGCDHHHLVMVEQMQVASGFCCGWFEVALDTDHRCSRVPPSKWSTHIRPLDKRECAPVCIVCDTWTRATIDHSP